MTSTQPDWSGSVAQAMRDCPLLTRIQVSQFLDRLDALDTFRRRHADAAYEDLLRVADAQLDRGQQALYQHLCRAVAWPVIHDFGSPYQRALSLDEWNRLLDAIDRWSTRLVEARGFAPGTPLDGARQDPATVWWWEFVLKHSP